MRSSVYLHPCLDMSLFRSGHSMGCKLSFMRNAVSFHQIWRTFTLSFSLPSGKKSALLLKQIEIVLQRTVSSQQGFRAFTSWLKGAFDLYLRYIPVLTFRNIFSAFKILVIKSLERRSLPRIANLLTKWVMTFTRLTYCVDLKKQMPFYYCRITGRVKRKLYTFEFCLYFSSNVVFKCIRDFMASH